MNPHRRRRLHRRHRLRERIRRTLQRIAVNSYHYGDVRLLPTPPTLPYESPDMGHLGQVAFFINHRT